MNGNIRTELLQKLNDWDESYTDWSDVIDYFVETADTVEDFKNNAFFWSNTQPSDQGDGVFILENHQFTKGDSRNDLIIVDLGDKRYAYKFD